MTRPRNAFAALTAALVLVSGCGDGGAGEDVAKGPTPSPAATAAEPTATASPAMTTTADASPDQGLWPPADASTPDPLAAARSFVSDFIGVAKPHLGRFEEAQPGVGEVRVFRTGEDGRRLDRVVSTLHLRRLDGTNWFVTSAESDEVVVTRPEPLAEVASPLEVEGRGRGFEGNVVLQLRAAGAVQSLVEKAVVAGAMGDLEPFEATLSFREPGLTGAVVAITGSGVAAGDGFAAFPVRFTAP